MQYAQNEKYAPMLRVSCSYIQLLCSNESASCDYEEMVDQGKMSCVMVGRGNIEPSYGTVEITSHLSTLTIDLYKLVVKWSHPHTRQCTTKTVEVTPI